MGKLKQKQNSHTWNTHAHKIAVSGLLAFVVVKYNWVTRWILACGSCFMIQSNALAFLDRDSWLTIIIQCDVFMKLNRSEATTLRISLKHQVTVPSMNCRTTARCKQKGLILLEIATYGRQWQSKAWVMKFIAGNRRKCDYYAEWNVQLCPYGTTSFMPLIFLGNKYRLLLSAFWTPSKVPPHSSSVRGLIQGAAAMILIP